MQASKTPTDWVTIGIIAFIVLVLAIMVAAGVSNARTWEAFKVAHKCKPVAKIKGDVFNTFTPTANGVQVGIGSTPDKTGWLCDDGITYYR